MATQLTANEEAQLLQTIEMFEVITQSQPQDYQSLEILKEAYSKLSRQKEVINTSKRIAEAYVQLGQLSSAILEYESILQQYPDDPDVQKALRDIENRATSFAAPRAAAETDFADKGAASAKAPQTNGKAAASELDDGRQAMHKIFVDGRLVSAGDFSMYWRTPSLTEPPRQVIEPFIQTLADKSLVPLDQSLKLICDRSRSSFMPLEKYDVDVELARSFPREICQRWCVLPFDRMSKSVLVATSNPFNRAAQQELEAVTKNRLLFYVAPPPDLLKVLKKIFR
ncbi:MAG: tetratricopeptide repeat protein [Verrucomicrobiota bacterium]|jgi:tetratricopeptide (TPR) repeat protein